jgi:signal peptidase I
MTQHDAGTGAETAPSASSPPYEPYPILGVPAGPHPPIQADDPRRRRGWIAFLLGVLLPPLGHVYAGRAVRGVGVWAAAFVAGVLALWITLHIEWPLARVALTATVPLLPLLTGADAARCAVRQPVPYTPKPYNRAWVYLLLLVPIFSFSALTRPLLLANVAHAWRIVSGSMTPTLRSGDYVMFMPLRGPITRGMVVTYRSENNDVCHRVVGLPGETLQMRGGRLYVNGRPLREPYVLRAPAGLVDEGMMAWQRELLVGADTAGYHPTLDDWGPLRVPEDSYFLLGDNRSEALDSRISGPIDRTDILQRAVWIYYSMGPDGPRWSRFGQTVR